MILCRAFGGWRDTKVLLLHANVNTKAIEHINISVNVDVDARRDGCSGTQDWDR